MELPKEIWTDIVAYLDDVRDWGRLEQVNFMFNQILLKNSWAKVRDLELRNDKFNYITVVVDLGRPIRSRPVPSCELIKSISIKANGLTSIHISGRHEPFPFLKQTLRTLAQVKSTKITTLDLEFELENEEEYRALGQLLSTLGKNVSCLTMPKNWAFPQSEELLEMAELVLVPGFKSLNKLGSLNIGFFSGCRVPKSAEEQYCFQQNVVGLLDQKYNLKSLVLWDLLADSLQNVAMAILRCGAHIQDLELDNCAFLNVYMANIAGNFDLLRNHPFQSLKRLTAPPSLTLNPATVLAICPSLEIFRFKRFCYYVNIFYDLVVAFLTKYANVEEPKQLLVQNFPMEEAKNEERNVQSFVDKIGLAIACDSIVREPIGDSETENSVDGTDYRRQFIQITFRKRSATVCVQFYKSIN